MGKIGPTSPEQGGSIRSDAAREGEPVTFRPRGEELGRDYSQSYEGRSCRRLLTCAEQDDPSAQHGQSTVDLGPRSILGGQRNEDLNERRRQARRGSDAEQEDA